MIEGGVILLSCSTQPKQDKAVMHWPPVLLIVSERLELPEAEGLGCFAGSRGDSRRARQRHFFSLAASFFAIEFFGERPMRDVSGCAAMARLNHLVVFDLAADIDLVV
jgi:hypothetical protein